MWPSKLSHFCLIIKIFNFSFSLTAATEMSLEENPKPRGLLALFPEVEERRPGLSLSPTFELLERLSFWRLARLRP